MGEIRIVGPGKTRGYPYPVCKNSQSQKLFAVDLGIFQTIYTFTKTRVSVCNFFAVAKFSTNVRMKSVISRFRQATNIPFRSIITGAFCETQQLQTSAKRLFSITTRMCRRSQYLCHKKSDRQGHHEDVRFRQSLHHPSEKTQK